MSGFPYNWDQSAKNGLQRLARMAIEEAEADPDEWVTREPLEAQVRYDPDEDQFELQGAPQGTRVGSFYREEEDAVDLLLQMWGNEIYQGSGFESFIEQLKIWDEMGLGD